MRIIIDFDGTMSTYNKGQYPAVGEPIPDMIKFIKNELVKGNEVLVFTARVNDLYLRAVYPGEEDLAIEYAQNRKAIEDWTEKHIGTRLTVTNMKTYATDLILDDLARTVIQNTGEICWI